MSSYGKFAYVYEQLMQDIPYDDYVKWVKQFAPVSEYPTLLDVGCGTGTLSQLLYKEGYNVSGLDISEEMLTVASEKFQQANMDIPLYCMSMDEIDGFTELDVVIIPIDSLNYLQSENEVLETFKRIYESLRNGGQLFFDVHSLYKMDEIFMQSPFTYEDDDIAYIWYTEEGEEEYSVYHDITFFVRDDETDLYERFSEEHYQRTYSVEQYKQWLQQVGFSEMNITSDFSENEPTAQCERIFFRVVK